MPAKEPRRPIKNIRLNYLDDMGPSLSLLGGKSPEIRIAPTPNSHLTVSSKGIALSPGLGNNFAIQGMSSNMIYGGMLQDLPFPLALLPTTPFTPFPKQMIRLPFLRLIPQFAQMLALTSSFAGI